MKQCTLAVLMTVLTLALSPRLVVPGPSTPAAQNSKDKESQNIRPEAIQGCYELGDLEWRPAFQGEDKVFITPPRRIQLLAEHGSKGFETNGYLVRPAPGIAPSIHRGSYWIPKGPHKIEIVWTTGFSGLTMELNLEGEILKGKARSHWDYTSVSQTAKVLAPKVPCKM